MKKILNIALVILLLFNSAGYVFTYWQLKVIFKKTALKKIEQSIPDKELQLIVTDTNGTPVTTDICRRVNKKEFSLNNEMYDIVRYELKDSLIHYYCLKDENENLLEAAFINYVENSPASPAGTIPVKNLMKGFGGDWETLEHAQIFFSECNCMLPGGMTLGNIFYPHIPVPPPEFRFC